MQLGLRRQVTYSAVQPLWKLPPQRLPYPPPLPHTHTATPAHMPHTCTPCPFPVKLLFPNSDPAKTYPFSLLGLGDIIIPGAFVSLCREIDDEAMLGWPNTGPDQGGRSGLQASDPGLQTSDTTTPYFAASLAAYGLGDVCISPTTRKKLLYQTFHVDSFLMACHSE